MTRTPQAQRDRERRMTVERYHRMKDAEEDYDLQKTHAETPRERQRLMDEFAAFREKNRTEDIARGKRSPDFGVQMHQILWVRWIEVAAEHAGLAEQAYEQICAGTTSALLVEFRHSLVAVTAAASTVEAVYEDARYLLPDPPRRKNALASEIIADSLVRAFGASGEAAFDLADRVAWLFGRRNEAVHPYAEPEPPRGHPSGLSTGSENSRFNACESQRALVVALDALRLAGSPPKPANRWVARWAREREPYYQSVVVPIRDRLAAEA